MLSKLVAITVGVLVIVLLVQGLVAYAMCSFVQGSPMPVLPFLAGLGVLAIGVLFYLTLAIALGAFALSRAVSLGLPMIIGIAGGMALQIFLTLEQLKITGYVTPWNLTGYGTSLATGASLAADQFWPWPVLATAAWIVLFVAAAIVRFDRIEL